MSTHCVRGGPPEKQLTRYVYIETELRNLLTQSYGGW